MPTQEQVIGSPQSNPPLVSQVREYWEQHPLCSYELNAPVGTREFFEAHDRLKREDSDLFCLHTWQFEQSCGKLVLDVGCGPGWLVRHYAQNGARIVGVDITYQAVALTQKALQIFGLNGYVVQANAELLPFRDDQFDFVSSSGVLHHTPNTEGAIAECRRVLKPGGDSVISLYYRNILLRRLTWPITRLFFRLLGNIPGRQTLKQALSVEEFVRIYDGDQNPVGKAYSKSQCLQMFRQFSIKGMEIHFFPKRFLVVSIPRFVHKFLDSWMGTMIYMILSKPNPSQSAGNRDVTG